MIKYEDVFKIVKEYGGHTGFVWLTKGTLNDAQCVMLKYDSTRRYFMSQITPSREFVRDHETHVEYHKNGETVLITTTTWKARPTLQRVSADVFKNNVEQLLKEGYIISF